MSEQPIQGVIRMVSDRQVYPYTRFETWVVVITFTYRAYNAEEQIFCEQDCSRTFVGKAIESQYIVPTTKAPLFQSVPT